MNEKEKIGKNLRILRKSAGFSLFALSREMGISYQQIQKYEWGKNHLSAVRLYRFARIFGVSPLDFFRGLEESFPRFDPDALHFAVRLTTMRSGPHREAVDGLMQSLEKMLDVMDEVEAGIK